jgi:hypothetical protein
MKATIVVTIKIVARLNCAGRGCGAEEADCGKSAAIELSIRGVQASTCHDSLKAELQHFDFRLPIP